MLLFVVAKASEDLGLGSLVCGGLAVARTSGLIVVAVWLIDKGRNRRSARGLFL